MLDAATDRPGGPPRASSTHRLVAAILGVLLLAAVAVGQAELWLSWFALEELPVACAFRRATGLPCPGCGLTRAWAALGRGAVGESLGHHRLGWLVMAYVAAQFVRHVVWLAWPRARVALCRPGSWLDWGLAVLVVALFLNWGLRLAGS